MFSLLSDKYLGVEVLDYSVGVFIGNCQTFLQRVAYIIMILKGIDERVPADEFFLLERISGMCICLRVQSLKLESVSLPWTAPFKTFLL